MNKFNAPSLLLRRFLWLLVFFIVITSLLTAHLDVKRFGCAFSLTRFQSLIPFAFELSPWQAANTSPSCDYPYGFLLYIIVSSVYNIFSAGSLPALLQTLMLKIPIVGAYCLYIFFLTKKKNSFLAQTIWNTFSSVSFSKSHGWAI